MFPRNSKHPEHKPFDPIEPRVYRYRLPGDWEVLAGKTDADNDRLSLRAAAPNDWWFHVHGLAGSHVILRAKADAEPGREVKKQAAAIAAFHSKARNAGLVPVVCTQARFVTKPKGAKPGAVQVRKETIIKVRPAVPVAAEGL